MPVFCCVINCGSRGERDNVGFYRIPCVLLSTHNKRMSELSWTRRTEWLAAIDRGDWTDTKLKNARVCSKHFISGKPAKLDDDSNPDWIPSLNMGYLEDESSLPQKKRYNSKKRATESQINTTNYFENNGDVKEEIIVLQADNCDSFLDENDQLPGADEILHLELVEDHKPKKIKTDKKYLKKIKNPDVPKKKEKDVERKILDNFSEYLFAELSSLPIEMRDNVKLRIVSILFEAKKEAHQQEKRLQSMVS